MKTTSSLVRVPTVSSGVVRPLTKFGLQSLFKLLQPRPTLSQGRFSTTDGSLAIVLGLKLSHLLVSDNRIKLSLLLAGSKSKTKKTPAVVDVA